MCRLEDCLVYSSDEGAIFSANGLTITIQKDEHLRAYDLEQYFGEQPIKRPDHLLIGRVEKGPWVVILAELKSKTGWEEALEKFQKVLPALGKDGESGGEQHHQECKHLFAPGKGHQVVAVVIGQVGKDYRKQQKILRTDRNRRPLKKNIVWRGKEVFVVSPMFGKGYASLRKFFSEIGILPRSK